MTQGKMERWHQTLKNRILLESYFLPGDLEAQTAALVDDYHHCRYHESIDNVTPADVYFWQDNPTGAPDPTTRLLHAAPMSLSPGVLGMPFCNSSIRNEVKARWPQS
jgi:hypothetical protein